MPILPASSITHQHLLSTIATEMTGRKVLRVVDVGCGGGVLTRYLRASLPELLPGCEIEVCGFDISDFAPHDNTNLEPDTVTVRSGDPWPYRDQSIDVMISNQVLEHVGDHRFFFGQIARCLKPDGVSIHLAPVREVMYDGHVCQPLVHKIRNRKLACRMVKFFRAVGFYSHRHASILPRQPGQKFPEYAVDYLARYCNYIPARDIINCARAAGLSVSFDYTPYFYTSKLRAMARRPPRFIYSRHRHIENVSAYLLRYLSSVTFVVRPQGR